MQRALDNFGFCAKHLLASRPRRCTAAEQERDGLTEAVAKLKAAAAQRDSLQAEVASLAAELASAQRVAARLEGANTRAQSAEATCKRCVVVLLLW